ncbi:PIN domain-like protein [Bombardia bombarda]|uniref:PIN domain-like protein n=1 Tax=Bombardia bombarda TaxID=252184 RepID=A0AA39U5G7_9PEZI|nr:PIN domain-like protein [Bombardia bombarda]
MGIPGIYKEIGPGERISLCKLAVEHLERTGRPFRLAIDISIWQFQAQAAKGGANPAIRTLFYRLVRLLSHAIEPLFVFDGPNKPAVKRNKRSNGAHGDVVGNALTKRLIRLFGFATHDAPGEAEAECALLQQQGIVDAVLSEDVDTIMFGCRRTLRAWTGEGKAAKTPTHVTMYDLTTGGQGGTSGLDREGMVLVALMSGGDYLPSGVQGFGVKVACEAAKAGFGRDLCRIKRNGYKEALAEWRGRLLHELRTNESGFFRTKHKALEIPEEFPGMEILRYYTHPVVSRQETVDRLRKTFPAKLAVDVDGLRVFVRDTFDWAFRIGAVKYIRVLAPGLLVQFLLQRSADEALRGEESALVRAISTKRAHPSTDATPELRISYIPNDIVKIDLNAELEEEVEGFGRSGIALNSEDEFEADAGDELEDGSSQPSKSGGKKAFDPLQPELAWIPESVVKLGTPLTVEKWEEKQRAKGSRAAAKTTAAKKTRAAKKPDMPVGALNKYVKVIKNIPVVEKDLAPSSSPSSPPRRLSPPPPPLPLSDQNINSLRLTRSAIGAKPISSSKPAVIPAAAKRLPSRIHLRQHLSNTTRPARPNSQYLSRLVPPPLLRRLMSPRSARL